MREHNAVNPSVRWWLWTTFQYPTGQKNLKTLHHRSPASLIDRFYECYRCYSLLIDFIFVTSNSFWHMENWLFNIRLKQLIFIQPPSFSTRKKGFGRSCRPPGAWLSDCLVPEKHDWRACEIATARRINHDESKWSSMHVFTLFD